MRIGFLPTRPSRLHLALASAVLVGACAGTESSPTPDQPAFAGTIFAHRSGTAGRLSEAPIAINGHGRERLIPLDLSPYYPGDDQRWFQHVIGDEWDVSPDGRYLYVAVYGKLIRADLPEGREFRELVDPSNTGEVQVSPTGHRLAFQRPAHGGEMWMVAASGAEPRRVLPPATGPGAIHRRPVWAGPTRLLAVQEMLLESGPEHRVMEMRAPEWVPVEIPSLRNRPVFGNPWGLLASSDGERLFLIELDHTPDDTDRYQLVEYDAAGGNRNVRIRFPRYSGWRVVLSPDASQVVTASDSGLVIYEIASGRKVAGPFGGDDPLVVPVVWRAAEYP